MKATSEELAIFVSVVESGSFSRAAEQLGQANSAVSRAVKKLEMKLGVSLLNRTTRQLSLTEEGERYFHRVQSILQEMAAAESEIMETRNTPRGLLRIDAATPVVDGRTEHQILHNLRQWGQGRTVIISAHRLSALTEASEIIVMQHGHIGQRGNHDVLVQQSGWYRDMYRYQQLEAALDDAPEIREEAIDA